MIHVTNCRPAQNLRSTQRDTFQWAKDVINAPVVDGSLPRIAPQIAKIFQKIGIRFAVMLRVVSEQVGLVSDADFEIEISGDEDNLAFSAIISPVNHVPGKCSAAQGAKGISMSANQNNLGQVAVR